ncbi:Dual serine/threonine and tyrosine protein kinase [Anabarilius grahami]|uniref:Dual serine/threonine and tyrosine protein kinase n=1 Tax=Anabarilius grahami TaxID=495550 RepID=A0A3N0YG30_ANAGA|nr:Dual serine/threonine and tyrosine protein kinase [Anabarilius grahami]
MLSGLHFPACTSRAALRPPNVLLSKWKSSSSGWQRKTPVFGLKSETFRTEATQTPGLSMIGGGKAVEPPRTRTSDPVRPPVRPSVDSGLWTNAGRSFVCLDSFGWICDTNTRRSGFWSRIRMENPQKAGPLLRDLTRAFNHYNKHNVFLKKNLKETIIFFREIRQNHSNTCSTSGLTPDSGQLSCISFPRHDEDYLQNVVGSAPYILLLGQDCSARYQLLNCLLGERLLPLGSEAGGACGAEGGACRRRKLCFTHGRQTRLSLALPGQYELVHQLAAHCGRWDTVPREDLEIQECEDPAQRLAELEITLHHALLQVRGSCSPHIKYGFIWSDGPAAQPAVYEEPCLQAIFVPERLQRSIALVSETALTDSIVPVS